MESKSAQGRSYVNGKAMSDDLRHLIIDDLKTEGAIPGDKLPVGVSGKVAAKFKVDKKSVFRLWNKYNEDMSVSRRGYSTGRPKKYGEEEVEFVKALKYEQPSMQRSTIRDHLLQHSTLGDISLSTISTIVRKDLNMTYKRIAHYDKNRYTQANLRYTQQFLDYVNNKNPFSLKFMDEMGVTLADGQPVYGHSEKGTKCVEITRYNRHANLTVSIIVGVTGVKYVKIIEGSSDSVEFLAFIGEAVQSFTDEGEPVFLPGECLVVDNAPTHHNMSERVLRAWLPTMGLEYLFLPSYSPDLNPAEQCFRKVKSLLKLDRFAALLGTNLKVAVYKAFSEITMYDTRSFFRATEYIDV